jgi:hypothetical protein
MKARFVAMLVIGMLAVLIIVGGCAVGTKRRGTIYAFIMGAGATPSMALARVSYHVPKIVLAARGWDNGLWWNYEKPNGRFDKWRRLGSNIKRDPIITLNEDSRLEVFATGQDDYVYHTYQQSIDGGWSPLIKLGGFRTNRPIQVTSNQDGRLEVFAIHPYTRKLWHTWQLVPNGSWSDWVQLSDSPALQNFVLTKNEDQRLEVFGVKRYAYDLWHVWQVVVNGGWSHWSTLNGVELYGSVKPVISQQSNGRLIVFVRGEDKLPYAIQQRVANGPWEAWRALPRCDLAHNVCLRQIHVHYNEYWNPVKRELALFTIDFSNHLRVSHQLNPDGNDWSPWQTFQGTLGFHEPIVSLLMPRSEPFRSMMIFTIFSDGSIRYKWQDPPISANWSQWENLSPNESKKIISIKSINGYYGCINVFAVTEEGLLKHIKQEVNDYTYCNDPDRWGEWNYLWSR